MTFFLKIYFFVVSFFFFFLEKNAFGIANLKEEKGEKKLFFGKCFYGKYCFE
jgi:hypothetical protein